MNILLINRSDSLGGAAKASFRLMNALRRLGHDARMLVLDKSSGLPCVELAAKPWRAKGAFLAERLQILLNNGFSRDTLFQIDTATHGIDISSHPWVRQADVLMLGWVNQGMLSVDGVRRLTALKKPMIWTMHDMWNCTGVCHHAYDCRRYTGRCTACPLTGKQADDISTAAQRRKGELYAAAGIHFVAVSHWLEQCCRQSSLMRDAHITVIGNPLDVAACDCTRRAGGDHSDKFVVAMGAARLDDPVKGFDTLIAATRHIADCRPELAQRLELLLYGTLRHAELLGQLALPFTHLGYVDNLDAVYGRADAVLSLSHYESFGYTLVEGLAHGCIPVTTGEGGQVDIVRHGQNGCVLAGRSPQAVADGLQWAATHPLDRRRLHDDALQRFDAPVIAGRYIHLIDSLIHQDF